MRVLDHQTVYRNPFPSYRSIVASAVSLCAVPDGSGARLIAAFRVGEAKMSPGGRIAMATSTDLGASWSPSVSPLDIDPLAVATTEAGPDPDATATRRSGGRPSLAGAHLGSDGAGTIILAASRMWVAEPGSTNFVAAAAGIVDADAVVVRGTASPTGGAVVWDAPRQLDRRRHADEWAIVCGVPLALGNGRWILPLERHAHADSGPDWLTRYHAFATTSTDDGRSWAMDAPMLNDPTGRVAHYDQRIAPTGDGRLLSLAWVHDVVADETLPARSGSSTDGGQTWGDVRETGLLGGPLNPIRLADGRILAAYARRAVRASLRIAMSSDDGRSWGPEYVVWDEASRQVRGELARSADDGRDAAELWDTMWGWTFGTPTAVELPDRTVGLTFFAAGQDGVSAIHFVRLAIPAGNGS